MKPFSIFSVAIVLFFFIACNKDNKTKEPDTKSDTEVHDKTISITYQVGNEKMTPIFAADITYTDENNEDVLLKDTPLPWKKTITVKLPYKANLKSQYILIPGATIPELVTVGSGGLIYGKNEMEQSKRDMTISNDKLEKWLSGKTSSFTLSHTFEE